MSKGQKLNEKKAPYTDSIIKKRVAG